MHEPELYHKAHREAKSVAGDLIREYFSKVQWRPDGCDTFMDIGSGPGDVLMDYIYPLIPQNFNKLIGSDISKEMVEFAKSYYRNTNKLEYRVLDIETQAGIPNDLRGTIDHLTSIFCLHFVHDYGTSLKNMFDLLRSDGGDCFIIFMPFNTVFQAYDNLKNSAKWLEYKQDFERFIPHFYYSDDPPEEFRSLLKEAGFSEITVDTKSGTCNYETLEIYKENIRSICGLMECITTPSLQSEFLDDLVAVMMRLCSKSGDELGSKYCVHCDFIIASAKKKI